jgi:hypothetical protein
MPGAVPLAAVAWTTETALRQTVSNMRDNDIRDRYQRELPPSCVLGR